ncbi:MAG: adenylate/guanylate cyclase domain-containing protein [Sulfitobacter sp.]|nr:adenylate/guanylate cyclase domain-containing protein [Sulfitobacter sp.]
MPTAHVLIADITGSTKLYEELPERDALSQISIILARMRTIIDECGGVCINSKGDDTLSVYTEAEQAFAAARAMIETEWANGMAVHAGAYWGEVLNHGTDVFGDAVNTSARLSVLAKPGEVLMGDTTFEQLSERNRALCVSMGGLKLKGKADPVRVHSFAVGDMDTQTVLFGAKEADNGPRTESAALQAGEREWTLTNGQSVMVGRSADCEAVLEHPWVSRKHGSFELRAAQLEYTDHSSSGSTVITADGQEFSLQRRSMPLNGEGVVLVGTRDPSIETSAVRYATNDLMRD